MSQENVEIVRRFLEGAQETPDAVWNIFDEEVEWDTGYWSAPDFPERTYGRTRCESSSAAGWARLMTGIT
jgi:hypothetical protein